MRDRSPATADLVLLRELPAPNGLKIVRATLNAEKTINAFTLGMVRSLDDALVRWAADPEVACVVLDGAGERGFCAGGDLRFLRHGALAYPGPVQIPSWKYS
jgi:enoyl-CoA hydratase/carnithine racemase